MGPRGRVNPGAPSVTGYDGVFATVASAYRTCKDSVALWRSCARSIFAGAEGGSLQREN